ncbi:transmembrane protein, putative (macronuclear) [Tetrahymena thermophila SB210]|uniref:Transmembrane protein, putative n=1 Tax=Tetrahymena thermophila (strain SB210) TaxID=312017 RepID=I7MFC9_TETTS|nr:transmembrane protein, putative [Tetrahymena thermophila SB210]EAR83801.2 transmembrane protein, putative [Tetrahymena thermophila SB210]|eukprot:XP_001031464.2 transmembrane protein, putative [Tetrahymena thermophila SB210]
MELNQQFLYQLQFLFHTQLQVTFSITVLTSLLQNKIEINLHIRTAYFIVKHLEMHDYTDLRRSVLYESIYQNHYNTCSRKDCFCELLMRENGFSWEELQGFVYRDSFISKYFAQMYSDYLDQIKKDNTLKKEEYNQACFNYLTFLIEVVNVPTKALAEVIQISNSEKSTSSIKDQLVFQQIYDHGEKIFYNFFNNPTIYNQKLQLNKVLKFDQLFLNTQLSLKQSLIQLRKMLIDLSKKQVDISQINQQIQQVYSLKQQTHATMRNMYSYYPQSKWCEQLADIYSKCLDQQNKSPQEYQKEAIYQSRQHLNSFKNIDKEINLFSKDACVINISLIQPIGIIKNASFSSQSIFGYSPSELISKNCNILIPDQLNQIHGNILTKFVSSGEMNRIVQGQLQIFGINKSGFAIPLNLRIKLDSPQSNYFGASAFITKQNSQIYDFIIFATSGNITNLTEKIYYEIFKNFPFQGHERLYQKLDLFKILPILQTHLNQIQNKNQNLNIEHKSIFISPQSEKAISVLSYKQNQPFNSFFDFINLCKKLESKDFKFYEITFQVGKLQTSYKNFELGFIQIVEFKQLKRKFEIQALLQEVKIQIEKIRQFCQLELDLNIQNGSLCAIQQETDQKNILSLAQFNQKQSLFETKSILFPPSQVTRPSLSSQISHLSGIKMFSYQSHSEFGSYVDHIELKQIEPICDQLSNNQYLNTNRKLLNNQDKCLINNEFNTEQSCDLHLNVFSSPASSRNKQVNFQESKLLLNDAILEDEKIDNAQNNEEGQNQSNSINSSISEMHTFKQTLKKAVASRRQRYEIMNEFVSIIAHTEYIKMYNKSIIQNTLQQQELAIVLAEPLVIQQHFKNTVIDLENNDRDTWYGQYIRSQYQNIIIFNQRNESSTKDLKMIFSFVSMAENLYMYSQKQTDVYLRYIHYNQKNSIEIFQNMADLQKQELDNKINQMKSFQVTFIIVLEVLTLLIAIQVIPIFFYIQYKKEQILKLFCTFQPSQLIERIQMLEYFINQDMLRDSHDQILLTKGIDNIKKRTVSSTNQLEKINNKILALVSFIFCFFSIYPITNIVISNTYIDEFSFNSNELSLLYSLRGRAPLILAFNFLRQTATYEMRPDAILSGLDGQLEDTQIYIRNTTNNSSHQIDISDCSTIQNGIWNKGYLLGLQSLTNILADFQQMYKASQTTDQFTESLSYLYQENNGAQFIKVYQYLRVVPMMIGNFMITEMNKFQRLFDTRQIFGLFPCEFICQNPYVYNYVRNEYQI